MASNNIEVADGEKVDKAMAEISKGNFSAAKSLLLSVVRNTPSEYFHQTSNPDGSLVIRFWDQQEFIHYVNWKKPDRKIFWNVAAYPRAYFYLGFIGVAERDYQAALSYLDKALELEPTNPKIFIEKAQALLGMKRQVEALRLFEKISEIGPFTSGADVARALRGRGFALIELGKLDEAKAVLLKSLEFDPDSKVAKEELSYIAQLKGSAMAAKTSVRIDTVTTSGRDMTVCVVCGDKVTQGKIVDTKGTPGLVCEKCEKKASKKSWQFWK
jgi:tetratricopeptide (TPR) repeat protein